MTTLDIAFSPCPNDTFVFHAMLHGLINTEPFHFTPYVHDVEDLNMKAFSCDFRITKLSFYAYLQLSEKYELLDSGAALGYGCGPLLVARSSNIPISKATIAIPGRYTTAYLLLKIVYPDVSNIQVARFDEILPGVQSGRFDAGLIIHEGRFVYQDYNCVKIIDLGEWWEEETGMPIPLGCIAIRRDQTTLQYKRDIESILVKSIQFAEQNRNASRDFIKSYAQELEDHVIDEHINLYVNEYTLSLGDIGERSIHMLKQMAQERRLLTIQRDI
ncbi:MAG: 1,4-dihydroxy-6-naphthoate synthase [Spirochaetota bacterium]|nr:1,4-dihydroxy-6-naphthoate synthase [Spirochaetota bacterium]